MNKVNLQEKFFGCIAGCHIGSAMGAAVEGMVYPKIEKRYGVLDGLLPYQHYDNGWMREPGTTEDGVERQKLMIAAIVKKQDRVNAEDVKQSWIENMNPNAPGNVSEPFEKTLLDMAKSGIPASDIGKYCDYAGLNSFARACHPIGLINAGDILGAIESVFEVGKLYQTANSRGLKWAAVTGIAIAAATKPNATVDSVLETIRTYAEPSVAREIDRGLKATEECKDIRQMREVFDSIYSGTGIPYAFSSANEVVTKAVCIFQMVNGNTKGAIIAGTNMGRDTDCVAAVAAGISGALTGGESIPKEWIEQVDYATSVNPFTNSKRSLRETSDALYEAFQTRLSKMQNYISEMAD